MSTLKDLVLGFLNLVRGRPKEDAAFIDKLGTIMYNHDLESGVFAGSVADLVKKEVMSRFIPLSAELKNELQSNNISLDELAHRAILRTCFILLSTGRFHTYRGVLSMAGSGISSIWRGELAALKEMKFIRDGEEELLHKNLSDAIQSVG